MTWHHTISVITRVLSIAFRVVTSKAFLAAFGFVAAAAFAHEAITSDPDPVEPTTVYVDREVPRIVETPPRRIPVPVRTTVHDTLRDTVVVSVPVPRSLAAGLTGPTGSIREAPFTMGIVPLDSHGRFPVVERGTDWLSLPVYDPLGVRWKTFRYDFRRRGPSGLYAGVGSVLRFDRAPTFGPSITYDLHVWRFRVAVEAVVPITSAGEIQDPTTTATLQLRIR